jgi:hypothetical protein
MDIRTVEGKIEAYIFERHIGDDGLGLIRERLETAPGVEFIGQFVGAFTLFARVVADDFAELQKNISGPYFDAGVRSHVSVNLTGPRPASPKRHSPNVCALVCAQTRADPFEVLAALDLRFLSDRNDYGAAVVTAPDFDLLVDLGADTVEQVLDRVVELRKVPGIGRTSTAVADVRGAYRRRKSPAESPGQS